MGFNGGGGGGGGGNGGREAEKSDDLLQKLFPKGALVEVSSDEEDFKGAWNVATVVELPSKVEKKSSKKWNKFLVEYESLLAEDTSSLLQEYVDAAFVRPLPPTDDDGEDEDGGGYDFEVNDVVDAFHRYGWWTGVVARVFECSGSVFMVGFQNPPEKLHFDPSEIRIHLDWVDGQWVRPEKHKGLSSFSLVVLFILVVLCLMIT